MAYVHVQRMLMILILELVFGVLLVVDYHCKYNNNK